MVTSTALSYANARDMVNAQQTAIGRLSQQLSSGQAMLSPSDDPLAAAQSINLRQADSINTTFASNRATATSNLGVEENALKATVTALQSSLQTTINAGNGTLTDADRSSLAGTLQSLRDTIMGYANIKDANGNYVFSGYAGSSQTFNTATGDYNISAAQDKQRMVQADATTSIAGSDTGASVFARANPGSQGYIAEASSTNTGTATFGAITFDSTAANAGSDYSISFTDDGTGALTYHVQTTAPDGTVTPDAYTGSYSGSATLDLGGAKLTLTGTPSASDTFTVTTNQTTDVNVFKTLDNLIAVLKAPVNTDADNAALNNALNTANKKLTETYNNVSTVQSSIGTRINRLDALDTIGTAKTESLSSRLSDLENVDLVSAVSEVSLRQAALTASSIAFKAIQSSHIYTQS